MKKIYIISLLFLTISLYSNNTGIILGGASDDNSSSVLMGNLLESLDYDITHIGGEENLKAWYEANSSGFTDLSTLVLYYNGEVLGDESMKYLVPGGRVSYKKLINLLLETSAQEIIVLVDSIDSKVSKPLVKIEGKATKTRKIVFVESISPLVEDSGYRYSSFSYLFAQNAVEPWTELFTILGEKSRALSEPIYLNKGFELSFESLLLKDTLVKDLIAEATIDDPLVETATEEIVEEEEPKVTSNVTTFEDDQENQEKKRTIKGSRIVGGLTLGAVATACFLSPMYLDNDTSEGQITMWATGGVFSVLGVIEIVRGFIGN